VRCRHLRIDRVYRPQTRYYLVHACPWRSERSPRWTRAASQCRRHVHRRSRFIRPRMPTSRARNRYHIATVFLLACPPKSSFSTNNSRWTPV
jgi:hypothetical protein